MNAEASLFEQHRGHLTGLAYRMLGEYAAAEDVVQDTFLRWQRGHPADVQDLRAYLSTIAMRLALDTLRSARARRERYVGPWLPEPILPDDVRAFTPQPDAKAELASDLSFALLLLLERLSPDERAAFVLHDAFDCGYDAIAGILEKSEAACRKLVSRARERVREGRPRFAVEKSRHSELLARFLEASASADEAGLVALLSADATAYTDGGGKALAALRPIYGAKKVARLIAGLARKLSARASPHFVFAEINGAPCIVVYADGALYLTLQIECDATGISSVFMMRNPDKLARLNRVLLEIGHGAP